MLHSRAGGTHCNLEVELFRIGYKSDAASGSMVAESAICFGILVLLKCIQTVIFVVVFIRMSNPAD